MSETKQGKYDFKTRLKSLVLGIVSIIGFGAGGWIYSKYPNAYWGFIIMFVTAPIIIFSLKVAVTGRDFNSAERR